MTERQRIRNHEGCSNYCTSCHGQAIEVQTIRRPPGDQSWRDFKDTCRWRGLFWLSLDQSTPIFHFRRLTLWQIFETDFADFFFRPSTLEHFQIALHARTSTSEQQSNSTDSTFFFFGFWRHRRQTRHSFGIRSEFGPIVWNSDQSFGIRTNRSEFGPIVRDSDQSIGIRTSRLEFGPITENSDQSLFTHFGPISTQIWTFFHQFYSFPLAEHWSSYYCEHLSTKQTLSSFTVDPFNIYFEDLMWLFTHLWRLDEQDRRLKISLSWHLISSLKTLTVESNILTNIFVLLTNCITFERLLCTQEPSTPRVSDTGTPGWR